MEGNMENNVLKLVLTHKWYDMIESNVKPFEYRGITPYWFERLVSNHEKVFKNLVGLNYKGCNKELKQHYIDYIARVHADKISFKPYTHVQFQRAYPKNPPRMTKAIKSIRIGTGKPELGAEPNKLYFVIELM
jgi:hypothetical protein